MSDSTTGRLPLSMSDVGNLLAGVLTPQQAKELLSATDRKGLGLVTYAALKGGENTDKLLPLLSLLEPPQQQEQTQLDQIIALLEAVAASQIRTEESQARTEKMIRQIGSALAGKPKASPRPQVTDPAQSKR